MGFFRRAVSRLYKLIAVALLGSWTVVALTLTAISALNKRDASLVNLIASPSLLTYLVSKLVVTTRPAAAAAAADRKRDAGLAPWIATADYGSPHGALVLFLVSLTWMWSLAQAALLLFAVGLVCMMLWASLGIIQEESNDSGTGLLFSDAYARRFSPVIPMIGARAVASSSPPDLKNTLLTEDLAWTWDVLGLDEMDTRNASRLIYAATLQCFVATVVIACLALYVASKTLGSLKRVLTAPAVEWLERSPAEVVQEPPPLNTVQEVRFDQLGLGREPGEADEILKSVEELYQRLQMQKLQRELRNQQQQQ